MNGILTACWLYTAPHHTAPHRTLHLLAFCFGLYSSSFLCHSLSTYPIFHYLHVYNFYI